MTWPALLWWNDEPIDVAIALHAPAIQQMLAQAHAGALTQSRREADPKWVHCRDLRTLFYNRRSYAGLVEDVVPRPYHH